jgi:elongation factor G
VLAGEIADGASLIGATGEAARVAGVLKQQGAATEKRGPAKAGDTAAFAKLDPIVTSDTVTTAKTPLKPLVKVVPHPPVMAVAISARERKDDVKLGPALHKLADEDPSLVVVHDAETGEIVLWGQGEMHLRVAAERLAGRYGLPVTSRAPSVGYRETIKKTISQRGRHKKQSGGHGQFGDVVVEIKPLPRGSGFKFEETITGGAVPRNYIPSVEEGVRSFLGTGPLGFPVVDLQVTLTDGSYHTVDSSDMAFQLAGRLAMSEGLPQCQPVLLEPIFHVEIVCPNEATAKINAILSQRRGQILGFDAREGWDGWDVVKAMLPESEIGDLIIEVRSATAGVGGLSFKFDHLQELTGKQADQVVAARRAAE